MKPAGVFIVVWRQPDRSNPKEKRMDPCWEFGSFGSTRCHMTNLLNPKHAKAKLEGARLAFAQGGPQGFKLVMLTPEVMVDDSKEPCEVLWNPHGMPFRYTRAPLLVDNHGRSDFGFVRRLVRCGNCPSRVSQFSSNFRTKSGPLSTAQGKALTGVFDSMVKRASRHAFAETYLDALPYPPPVTESLRERGHTLQSLRAKAKTRPPSRQGTSNNGPRKGYVHKRRGACA